MKLIKTKNPFKSTLLFGVFSFLRSGISLLLLPIFLNYLSPEDYGIVSLVIIYSGIIAVLGSLGLKSALLTFYFDFDDKRELREYLSNLFSIHGISFILILSVHLLFGDNIYNFIFKSNELSFYNYGLIALISVFFDVLNRLYFIFLKNEINLKLYFRYISGTIVLTAFFQILLITKYDLKIYGLLLGTLISNFIIFIIISLSNRYLFTLNFKKKLLIPSLNYSLKLLPFLLFFAFENQIDKYLIELNLGLKNVGLYALLIKIFGLLTIAINAIDDGIRPFIYRDLKSGKRTLNKYFNLYIGFGVLILVLINAIGYNLEYIIKNKEYLVIQEYFFIGSIAFLMIIPVRFFGLLLVYYKESSKLSFLSFIKITIIALLMMFLIPKYQIYGALYALFISYLINVVLFAYIVSKKVIVIPNKKTLAFLLIFISCTYYMFIHINSSQNLLFSIMYIIILVCLFVVFYFKEGYSILNQKS